MYLMLPKIKMAGCNFVSFCFISRNNEKNYLKISLGITSKELFLLFQSSLVRLTVFFHSRSIDWKCNGCDVCIKTVLLETTGRQVLTII